MVLLAIALAVAQDGSVTPLLPVFRSEGEALAFSTSFGPEWYNPHPVKLSPSTTLFGVKMKLFEYRMDEGHAYVGIGTDPAGKIGLYDVRFPTVGTNCVVPDTKAMARTLLEKFEPEYASDTRNINRVASTANLVWPYTAFHSSPSAVVGQTVFTSFKMNGFCRVRVVRRSFSSP